MNLNDIKVGMRVELRPQNMDVWEPEPLTIRTIRNVPVGEPWDGTVRLSAKRADGTLREILCWYWQLRLASKR